jgi:hypothetical protein
MGLFGLFSKKMAGEELEKYVSVTVDNIKTGVLRSLQYEIDKEELDEIVYSIVKRTAVEMKNPIRGTTEELIAELSNKNKKKFVYLLQEALDGYIENLVLLQDGLSDDLDEVLARFKDKK